MFFFLGVECISQQEIDNHLEMGRQFLARGQLADALTQYHAAVGKSFLCYYGQSAFDKGHKDKLKVKLCLGVVYFDVYN